MALSLFGLYDLRFPISWQKRFIKWSDHHQGGTYLGVFFMGGISILIVSPCVSAPLVGVLSFIAHDGNILFGGLALLALSLGMGIPLLLLGTSAGKLLPRSGPWMFSIKAVFGIIMLGMAIWIVHPLWSKPAVSSSSFVVVKSMSDLDQQFSLAKKTHKIVLLDFYADWCASCIAMDKTIFHQRNIQAALQKFILVRADITQNNAFDKTLLKRFGVIAPPVVLFLDEDAHKLPFEHVGEISAKKFLADLNQLHYDRCKQNTQYC